MAKLTISRWDSELSIPIGADQDLGDMKLGSEVEVTVKGKIKAIRLAEPEDYEKKKGVETSGMLTILTASVEVDGKTTEFEIASNNFECCCDD